MMSSSSQSMGLLSLVAGSLLLCVHFYSVTCPKPLLPGTALGVLLLLFSSLVGYAGIQKTLHGSSLFVSLCLAISALWCGYGVVQILAAHDFLHGAADLRDAVIPGLVAFSLGLLLVALVGFLQREVTLAMMASAISFACAHEVASFYDVGFGSSATACGYLVASLASGYIVLGRGLFFLSKEAIVLPVTDLAERRVRDGQIPVATNDLIPLSLILNALSASVFGCRLLGLTGDLFVGQVPWLWVGAVYQLGVSIFSYRRGYALMATFSSFTSLLDFAGGYSLLILLWLPELPAFPVPLFVGFALLLATLAIFLVLDSLADGLYILFYVVWCVALACSPHGFFNSGPQGVSVAIFVASALMALVHLYNQKASIQIPRGEWLLKSQLSRLSVFKFWEGKDPHAPYLGYSKYADAEALGYASSMLASFAIMLAVNPASPLAMVIIPWVVVAGGLLTLLCSFVAISHGKVLESSTFIFYGAMWMLWGLARYGGLYGMAWSFQVSINIGTIMVLNAVLVFGTLFLTLCWFAYCLVFELVLLSFLLHALDIHSPGYEMAVTIMFGLVSFYGFLSALVNSTFEWPRLPVGRPILKFRRGGGEPTCPHLPARRASSVKRVADIMKQGGACGIPTDTVYVLAAACNRPDAVEKAYHTKLQAQDRPMSLWISSLKQLEPAKHLFSPVLWDFMDAAWPSPISLVVPRGKWVDHLGLEDSAKYVGTAKNIAIRIPNCSVTTHLIDLVGPITVTSANPTGEADTTHHNQVYAKLGDKVDAVLCDGPSPENIASTVVDCTKIENGSVGFFRVGIVPQTQVLQILEQVQRKHHLGQKNKTTMATEGEDEPEDLLRPAPNGSSATYVPGDPPTLYPNEVLCSEEDLPSQVLEEGGDCPEMGPQAISHKGEKNPP
ncbi:uncharacterized protein LOC121923654 [Sceloporus undulatus]|uniref:uncharacterized protein LOC121923654 n=1 Tax=Sceloporus undulatus TaxID=8520 RepID=UPI001C4ABE8B|nr:uncharacterized protein LOC121923654 [Sceloporus undulatus]